MYSVIDRVSRNVLGEFETFVSAESCLLEWVGAHPPAAHDIVIVGPSGPKRVEQAKLERAASEAAVAATQ